MSWLVEANYVTAWWLPPVRVKSAPGVGTLSTRQPTSISCTLSTNTEKNRSILMTYLLLPFCIHTLQANNEELPLQMWCSLRLHTQTKLVMLMVLCSTHFSFIHPMAGTSWWMVVLGLVTGSNNSWMSNIVRVKKPNKGWRERDCRLIFFLPHRCVRCKLTRPRVLSSCPPSKVLTHLKFI